MDMETQTPLAKLLRHWRLLLSLLLLVLAITYISGHGFLSIDVAGSGGKTLTISILNEKTKKTMVLKNTSGKILKFTTSGPYQIVVEDDKGTFFSTTETAGFLRTTRVSGTITAEKSREYIGNSPRTCTYYTGNILYSYYCNDSYANTIEHVPASPPLATYVKKVNSSNISGTIEGTANAGNVAYLLVKALASEGATQPVHTVYTVSGDTVPVNTKSLADLDGAKTYNLVSFAQGFLVSSQSSDDFWYYDSGFTNPTHLTPPKLSDDSMKRVISGASQDTFVLARSNKADFQNHDNNTIKIGNVKTQVDIYKNGSFKSLVFNQELDNFFTNVQPCGDNLVCFVSNQSLYVYDVGGKSAKLRSVVSGVNTIFSGAGQTLLVQDKGILDFDAGQGTGYYSYIFGPYHFCGLTPNTASSYTICVADSGDSSSSLLINQFVDNKDSIDKKISDLRKVPEIKSISPYANYIFIAPNLGQPVYDKAIAGFDYSADAKAAANAKINAAIKQANIDQSVYTVVNSIP